MGDGPQTLLDVIDSFDCSDSHVLDKFFETFPSATLDDSPRYDNVPPSENNILANGIDAYFDNPLSDPPRGVTSYTSHLPTSSHLIQQALHPPNFGSNAVVNSTASNQLFAHALHPVHLGNHTSVPAPQYVQPNLSQTLPTVETSDCVGRGTEQCSRSDQDAQSSLHQLLATGSTPHPTQSAMQLHSLHQSLSHQDNLSSALQMSAATSLLHTHPHLNSAHVAKPTTMCSVVEDKSGSASVLMSSSIASLTTSHHTSGSHMPSVSLNSFQILPRGSNVNASMNAYVQRTLPPTSNSLIRNTPVSSKDHVSNVSNQLVNSIALTGASPVISGSSLLNQGNQLLPNPASYTNSGILQAGHLFQGSSIVPCTSILTNPIMGNAQMVSSLEPSVPASVSRLNGSQNINASHTYSSPVVVSNADTVISTVPETSSSCTTSYSSSSKSPVVSIAKVSPAARHGQTSSKSRSHSSRSPSASPHSRNIKSPLASQPQSIAVSQANLTSMVSGLGVVQGLMAPLPASSINGANGVINAAASNLKQMVPGGHVIQLVSSSQTNLPRPTAIHSVPKPIQPKQPQLLPKPSPQGNLRQSTPPPPGKTLIGSRSQPVSTQQPLLLSGANQHTTVLAGQPNLGSIILNPSGIQQPLLLSQNGGMQLLLRTPQSNNTGQTILVPMAGQSQLLPSVGKAGTSQTVGSCTPQGLTTYVINPGLSSSLPGNVFATSQGPRPAAPILRFVAPPTAPVQFQQIQAPNGPTFLALPGQPAFNLSGMFASTSGTVRTIGQQMAPGTLQLASVPTVGNIQLPGSLSNLAGQNFQVNSTPLSSSTSSPLVSQQQIIVKNAQSSAVKKDEKPLTSVITSPIESKNSKKKSKNKKKKETQDDKKDEKEVSINLNELLKQTGIVSEMMFEDNDFEPLNIENIDSGMVNDSKSQTNSTIYSSATSGAGDTTTQSLTTLPSLVSPSPITSGTNQVCLAVDANGKLIVCQPDFPKNLAPNSSAIQIGSSVVPSNSSLLNPTSAGSFIITNPNSGFQPSNLSLVSVPNAVIATTKTSQNKVIDSVKGSTHCSVSTVLNTQIVHSTATTNTNSVGKDSTNRIQVSIPFGSPICEKKITDIKELSGNQLVDKCKKSRKKNAGKEKKNSLYINHPLLLPNNSKVEVPVESPEKKQMPGESMPSFSFGIQSSETGRINSSPSPSSVVSLPNYYSHKTQPSTISPQPSKANNEWPPAKDIHKIYLTPQNNELFQKLQAQIQAIELKSHLDSKDKASLQRLKSEQQKIISSADSKLPSRSVSRITTTTPTSGRSTIKYSHSVGHQKILLSPPQKKPCIQPSLKDAKLDLPASNQAVSNTENQQVGSTTSNPLPMCAPSMPSLSPKGLDTIRKNKPVCQISPVTKPSFLPPHSDCASSSVNTNRIIPAQCSTISKSTQPVVSGIPLTRHQLFEHQLATDQNGALNPDYMNPFKSKVDACKRLVRYHVFHENNELPEAEQESTFNNVCERLIRKKSLLEAKFQSLLIKESMRKYDNAEDSLIHKIVLNEEKSNFEKEKNEVVMGKEIKFSVPPSQWKIGNGLLTNSFLEDEWEENKLYKMDRETNRLINLHQTIEETPIESEEELPDEPRLTILEEETEDNRPHSPQEITKKVSSESPQDDTKYRESKKKRHKRKNKDSYKSSKKHRPCDNGKSHTDSHDERGGLKLKLKQLGTGVYYSVGDNPRDPYRSDPYNQNHSYNNYSYLRLDMSNEISKEHNNQMPP